MNRARIGLIAVITTLFQLGLAVLGWGGPCQFFAHRALVAFTIVTVVLVVAATFSSGNLSSGEREDRGNRWVLWVFALLTPLIAYLPAYADRMEFWTLDGDTLRWIGVVLYAVGGCLRLWPVFVLGRRFSGLVAIQPGHTLVTTGVYRVIRNPSYLGLLIILLGWDLVFRSGVGLLLSAFLIPPLIGRIRAEEKLLREQFTSQYDDYYARTWRLIPLIY